MKILILLLLCLPFLAIGQRRPELDNPDALPNKDFGFSVKKIAPAELKLPFSFIRIIDNRFDTSKLGFVPVLQIIANKRRVGRKISFKEGVARSIQNYYNEYYQNAFSKNDIGLVIVLKKMWFSGIDNEKNRAIDILRNVKARSYLYCKWEYYLQQGDGFLPVKRIDTVVNGVMFESEIKNDIPTKTNSAVLKLILNGMIEVPDFNEAVFNIDKLPKKTWQDIEKFNAVYYDMPILKDTVVNTGVYISFNEFKNNRPSVIEFKEKSIKIGLNRFENYLEDSKGNRITDYWGYAIAGELKIGKYGNERLFKKNHTFEFFIPRSYPQSSNEKEVWIPYQIDMETGNIY
jgi:hypothetical protein